MASSSTDGTPLPKASVCVGTGVYMLKLMAHGCPVWLCIVATSWGNGLCLCEVCSCEVCLCGVLV